MTENEKDLAELDGLEAYDEDEDIVELTDEEGGKHRFAHLGTIEHGGKYYACFQPAEKMEDVESDEVVILEVGGEGEEAELLPIEDEALLDEVFQAFCEYFDEEEAAEEAEELEGCDCDDEDCECCHHHKD